MTLHPSDHLHHLHHHPHHLPAFPSPPRQTVGKQQQPQPHTHAQTNASQNATPGEPTLCSWKSESHQLVDGFMTRLNRELISHLIPSLPSFLKLRCAAPGKDSWRQTGVVFFVTTRLTSSWNFLSVFFFYFPRMLHQNFERALTNKK